MTLINELPVNRVRAPAKGTPNNTLNRSAQKLRFWVPAPLRAAAPG
jgi:hypothetical protein